jgi:O-acetyl-ADP-ribose deacetylase (regulator of RNase III)
MIVECRTGDITQQPDVDAIVNAANAQLRPGGGVAGAIHRAAGPGLDQECRRHAPIRPGEAVITGAHALPNHFIIHCLGPVYGRDEPADRLLASCYRSALRVANEHSITSVAFPSLSTGAFGYPMVEAARVALNAVITESHQPGRVSLVRFVLFDDAARRLHQGVLDALTKR